MQIDGFPLGEVVAAAPAPLLVTFGFWTAPGNAVHIPEGAHEVTLPLAAVRTHGTVKVPIRFRIALLKKRNQFLFSADFVLLDN